MKDQKMESGICYLLQNVTLLRLTGGDRQKWLHNFCTADITSLQPGQGSEAFVLNVKGKTIAHVIVLVSKFDLTVIVIGEPELKIEDHFNKYIITEDVQVENIGHNHRLWYASGQKLRTMLEKYQTGELYNHSLIRDRSIAVESRICGEHDWLMLVNMTEDLSQWYGGLDSIEEAEFENLRIAGLFPKTGREVTQDRLPQEFRRDEVAISFDKGCYLGQETVARIDALGHVNYFFVQVDLESELASNAGFEIKRDDKVVGRVTSVAGQKGLGFVRRMQAKSGEEFQSEFGTVVVI